MRHLLFLLAITASAQTVINGGRTFLGPVDMTGATATKPIKSAASAPATCVAAKDLYWNSTDGLLYKCSLTPANTWEPVAASGGSESTTPSNSGATGASVLKTSTNVVARKLIGGAYITATENTDDITIVGQKGYTFGTSIPGTCTTGDIFMKTDATAGQNAYFCTATNTFTQQLNSGASASISTLTGYGQALTTASGVTNYFTFNTYNGGLSEASGDTRIATGGTIRNLSVKLSTPNPSGVTLTCRVRKIAAAAAWNAAGSDTAVTLTVPTAGAEGWYNSGATTDTVADGDRITMACTAAGGTSGALRGYSMELVR